MPGLLLERILSLQKATLHNNTFLQLNFSVSKNVTLNVLTECFSNVTSREEVCEIVGTISFESGFSKVLSHGWFNTPFVSRRALGSIVNIESSKLVASGDTSK
mmetsp:Transcript_23763/g.46544  ORF Transcript_23763/g.46544 Transcript_23763/m.46544 type:complete len:103 (-) Transcript_23763:843-1151(-)